MRNILLSNYEVLSVLNSSNNTKESTDDLKKKVANSPKDKQMDRFSILLDTQLKSMR